MYSFNSMYTDNVRSSIYCGSSERKQSWLSITSSFLQLLGTFVLCYPSQSPLLHPSFTQARVIGWRCSPLLDLPLIYPACFRFSKHYFLIMCSRTFDCCILIKRRICLQDSSLLGRFVHGVLRILL